MQMKIPAFMISVAVGLASLSVPVSAQFVGPGSGSGRNATVTTVAEVADARIGARAVLEGHIVEHQRSDYYTFKDGTGSITAEIEPIFFRRQQVTPETRVRLHGEVDRSFSDRRYIEVRRLEVLD
mgnify:CR=1 FL=1